MFKSKTKMISFRLSQDEFLEFRRLGLQEGFASFSDLVRVAVQQLLAKRAQQREMSLQASMAQIQSRMDELDRNLKQLLGGSPAVTR